jgi:VWFA-related protein
MRRILIALTLGAAAAPVGPIAQAPRTERPSSQILIDVVALDGKGNPVTDLRRDELEIWISGYRVPIDTFVAVTPGGGEPTERLMVIVLDDLTLQPALVARAREVARRFVNRMSPGDEIAIVRLNGSLTESTDDRRRLLGAIDSFNAHAAGVLSVDRLGEQVLTTVAALARQLATAPERRKTIVAIGSAWLLDTPIPPPTAGRELRREWTDAMRAMAIGNVSFYVIDPSGVGMQRASSGSSGFGREAGGHAFINTNDFNEAADRIMREAVNYYLIGVTDPPRQRKADLRELDVRVLRRGVTLRARTAIPGSR